MYISYSITQTVVAHKYCFQFYCKKSSSSTGQFYNTYLLYFLPTNNCASFCHAARCGHTYRGGHPECHHRHGRYETSNSNSLRFSHPGLAEQGNDGQGGLDLSTSRALSVSSFDGSQHNSTTNIGTMDADPFDEDEVRHQSQLSPFVKICLIYLIHQWKSYQLCFVQISFQMLIDIVLLNTVTITSICLCGILLPSSKGNIHEIFGHFKTFTCAKSERKCHFKRRKRFSCHKWFIIHGFEEFECSTRLSLLSKANTVASIIGLWKCSAISLQVVMWTQTSWLHCMDLKMDQSPANILKDI